MPNGEMEEKMDKFIVNIIHRPEMVPEYAEKVTGHGKEAVSYTHLTLPTILLV